MKTLNIKSTGLVEFNYEGLYIHTDTSDQDVPAWAMDNLNWLVAGMLSDGITELHIEDTGQAKFQHRVKNAQVMAWEDEYPLVFLNMAEFASEYMARHNASEKAKAEALAEPSQNDLTATQKA